MRWCAANVLSLDAEGDLVSIIRISACGAALANFWSDKRRRMQGGVNAAGGSFTFVRRLVTGTRDTGRPPSIAPADVPNL